MMVKHRFAAWSIILFLSVSAAGCTGNAGSERISDVKPERKAQNNVYLAGGNVGGMSESVIRAKLLEHAAGMDIAPKNASLDGTTWEIIPERPGKKLAVEKTLARVLRANEGSNIDYIVETQHPGITAAHFKKNVRKIADFTTELLDNRDSRVNNIQLAVEKINGKVLKPGDEFSFNGTVGRRTAAKGYEEAPIIVHTPNGPKKKMAKGGGVCQVSTTIYNAVEKCGLKITERHLHSMDPGYVPRGDDATVSYGTADFRFVNNRRYPVMLKLGLNGDYLTVRILENRNPRQ